MQCRRLEKLITKNRPSLISIVVLFVGLVFTGIFFVSIVKVISMWEPTLIVEPTPNQPEFYSGVYAGCIAAMGQSEVTLGDAVEICNDWTQSLDDVDLYEKFYEPPPAVESEA